MGRHYLSTVFKESDQTFPNDPSPGHTHNKKHINS